MKPTFTPIEASQCTSEELDLVPDDSSDEESSEPSTPEESAPAEEDSSAPEDGEGARRL